MFIMSAEPVPMPTRRSKEAPRFNVNDPPSLWTYFLNYESLAEAAQLDEAKKIQHSTLYLDRDEAEFWECLDEFSGKDWLAFKNVVLSFYPGSIPENRWTLNDLNELCNVQKNKSIQM